VIRIGRSAAALILAAQLAGCAGGMRSPFDDDGPQPLAAPGPQPTPEIAASIRPDDIIGKWGLASYHKADDRIRTESAAHALCRQPYVIGRGSSGGVVMHLADEAMPMELRLKGSVTGRNYIGPPGPPGGDKDREIISFNGSSFATRFVDADADGRYGTMVYVRCAEQPVGARRMPVGAGRAAAGPLGAPR
jgi:hypothetical protein